MGPTSFPHSRWLEALYPFIPATTPQSTSCHVSLIFEPNNRSKIGWRGRARDRAPHFGDYERAGPVPPAGQLSVRLFPTELIKSCSERRCRGQKGNLSSLPKTFFGITHGVRLGVAEKDGGALLGDQTWNSTTEQRGPHRRHDCCEREPATSVPSAAQTSRRREALRQLGWDGRHAVPTQQTGGRHQASIPIGKGNQCEWVLHENIIILFALLMRSQGRGRRPCESSNFLNRR